MLDSHKRKEETRAKEILATNYNIASLTAEFVGRVLNGKHLPDIHEVFPSIDGEEAKKKQEEVEAMRYKMNFMNFAMNANAARAKRGGATLNDA